MTELEELKAMWVEHDRKLEASLRLNRSLLGDRALSQARVAVGRVRWGIVVELVLGVIAPLWLGSFTWDHLGEPRFAIPGALLLVGAIAALHGTIRQLAMTHLDPGAAITRTQHQIQSLRRLRGRCVRWTLLLSPLAWTPLVVVTLESLFGVDAWQVLGVAWIVANLAFGIVVPLVAVWAARRFGTRWRTSRLGAWMADELSGRTLAAAGRALDAIAAFEREPDERRP